jgi:predicted RNA binding protein YcfA (HicA-like mRNA interferase family)
MKPMKLIEVVKMLELNGFTLIRSSGHSIYGCGHIRIAIAHQRIVSPGLLRSVHKAIESSKSVFKGEMYG